MINNVTTTAVDPVVPAAASFDPDTSEPRCPRSRCRRRPDAMTVAW